MIRNVRNSKVLLKNSLMVEDVRFQLAHSAKNYIDVDLSSSEHSDHDHIQDHVLHDHIQDPVDQDLRGINDQ